jgi:hypothetical protein
MSFVLQYFEVVKYFYINKKYESNNLNMYDILHFINVKFMDKKISTLKKK